MNDKFRKSGRPTDGMAPLPFARPWLSEPNDPEPAGLPGANLAEGSLEGLEPFDFRATPDMRIDSGRVIPIRPAIPDDLDRAFHELPSAEMSLFGADDRIAAARDDEETTEEPRRPSRWRAIARTFTLASVLLVLSPFIVSYPYKRISAALPELSFDTVAQAASDLRDAIPALTKSVQARLPGAEWLATWLEPATTRSQAPDPASALAGPAVVQPAAAQSASRQVEPPTRLELVTADPSSLERSGTPRVRPDTRVPPSVAEIAIASGTGADILSSAGSAARDAAPVPVMAQAGAPAVAGSPDAQTTADPNAAPSAAETRPTLVEPSVAPAVAPLSPADLDALLARVPPAPAPGSQDGPAAMMARPGPRLDGSSSSDPGAELVEALARERKEALDRERERADALARELVGLRDAIGAMKASSAPNWMNVPASAPAALPQQSEAPPPPAEPLRVESMQVGPVQVGPLQVEPVQVGPLQVEPVQVEPVQVEPVQVEPVQVEPLQAEPVQAAQPLLAPVPTALPVPDPVRAIPPPPPREQVRLDPPQSAAPLPPVTRLPDADAATTQPQAPRPPVQPTLPQAVVQAPSTPATAPNEQRLIERAETLLKLYDISGARLVLERAMTAGSARAAYLLAQTYDPRVLDEWRVVGIKGDPGKAQDLYARAQAGGVREAGQRRP